MCRFAYSIMVEFIYNTDFSLVGEKNLSDWLISIVNNEGFTLKTLQYNYVSLEQIHALNKQYLKHDYPTDVITFDYCEAELILGEVFISQDQVETNAKELSQSAENETLRVICHALLHLCGYSDKTKKEKTIMRKKEDACIASFHTTFK